PPANAKLERPQGEAHDAIRDRLAAAPCFWLDLVADLDLSAEELHAALWDLVWAGEVTNDAFAPLRARRLSAVQRSERRGRRFASRRAPAGPALAGRWSLTAPLFAGAPPAGPRLGGAHARAPRHRRAGDGARRRYPRRLLRPLRRALQPRDARSGPPRLLRRGARRRPVRAPRRRRAPARPAARRGPPRHPRRHRPGEPLRRRARLARP